MLTTMVAGPLWRHPGLPPLLMMEAYHRACPGTYQGRSAPEVMRLGKEAWNDAGYCLDAPDDFPAGACAKVETGPDADDWIVEQLRAYRE